MALSMLDFIATLTASGGFLVLQLAVTFGSYQSFTNRIEALRCPTWLSPAIACWPIWFMVGWPIALSLRSYMRDRKEIFSQLNDFKVDNSRCFDDRDRLFVS